MRKWILTLILSLFLALPTVATELQGGVSGTMLYATTFIEAHPEKDGTVDYDTTYLLNVTISLDADVFEKGVPRSMTTKSGVRLDNAQIVGTKVMANITFPIKSGGYVTLKNILFDPTQHLTVKTTAEVFK